MLDGVERGTLRRQHSAGLAPDAHDVSARRDAVAVLAEQRDFHIRVERAEEGGGYGEARQRHRVAAVHHAIEDRIGGDHCLAGDVAAVGAEVFGKG